MITKYVSTSLGLVLLAWLMAAQTPAPVTPSVDEILDHYVTALGGRGALEKVTSTIMNGTIDFPTLKTSGTITEYLKYPDHFAAVTQIADYGTVRTVYDGKTGWEVDPGRDPRQISGPELSDLRRRSDIHWNLKLKDFYPGLRVKGRENVNGKDAWNLSAIVDTWTYGFFFDVGTGLLVRFDTDSSTPTGPSSVSIGDYRPVGGVLFAFAASESGSTVSWNRKLSDVKVNVPVDDATFASPAAKPVSESQSKPRSSP